MSSYGSSNPPPAGPLIPSDANLSSLFLTKRANINKGTVTQLVGLNEPVTVNASAGVITMFQGVLASDASIAFTVTNSYCSADSVVLVNVVKYNGPAVTTAVITAFVTARTEGTFTVMVGNGSGAVLDNTEGLEIAFLIV